MCALQAHDLWYHFSKENATLFSDFFNFFHFVKWKIAFSDSLTGPYSPSSQPFTESFVEGPSVDKLGDDYLIYFDVYKKKIYGAMRTRDFKNFTDITESVSVPVGHKHGTIFKASESDVKTLLEESKKK